jgi:hypothetical protein
MALTMKDPTSPGDSQVWKDLVVHPTNTSRHEAPADLKKWLGQHLEVKTNNSRISISLLDPAGNQLGWFDKPDRFEESRPGTHAVVTHPNRVTLVVPLRPPKSAEPKSQWSVPSPPPPQVDSVAQQLVQANRLGAHIVMETPDRLQMSDGSFIWKTRPAPKFEYVEPEDFHAEHIRYGKQSEYSQPPTKTPPQKGNTMTISNTITATINANKAAAATAGYMEAGRIANSQVIKLISPHLPFLLKAYADTPFGKLVVANIAALAAKQLRPQDATLAALTDAMTVQAFQAIYQQVDFEAMINSLLSSPEMKSAIDKLPKDPTPTGQAE